MEGSVEFIKELKDEVHISVGHTTADYDTAKAAFEAGADHVTHLYNAMPPLNHRAPGVIGAAADNDHVYAELISDGLHIHGSAIRAAFRMFGPERIVLISDSMMACGMETVSYTHLNSLNGKKQILLQELICQPFILTEKEMSYRRMLSEYLASRSLEIQPVFEVGNTELICRMLEKNASAISLLPDYVTEKAVQEKRLVRLDVKDFQLAIWKQLLYHRDKWISPQMQAFMNVIKEVQA